MNPSRPISRITFKPPGAFAIAPSLAQIAAQQKISPKYLPKVWAILNDKDAVGPIAKLQAMWNALPTPSGQLAQWQEAQLRADCLHMREFVVKIRSHTAVQFAAPH